MLRDADIAAKRSVEFAALLGSQHPERGAVSPIEFIPIAEQNGRIFALGEWVLREACRRTRLFGDFPRFLDGTEAAP